MAKQLRIINRVLSVKRSHMPPEEKDFKLGRYACFAEPSRLLAGNSLLVEEQLYQWYPSNRR